MVFSEWKALHSAPQGGREWGTRDKPRRPGLNACSPTRVFNLLEENEARPPAVHDQAFLVSPRSTGRPVDATCSMISAARARPFTSSMIR